MIGVEVFDLDAIGYEGAYEGQKGTRRRSLEERLVDVRSISEKPGWVAERVFLWWVDELFDNADVILWLDFPYRIRTWRAAKRDLQRTIARNNTQGGLLSQINWLFRHEREYQFGAPRTPRTPDDDEAVTRAGTALHLEGYPDKVIHCRGNYDVDTFLTGVLEQS